MSQDRTIYAATRAAYVDHDGQTIIVRKGATVRAGHPLIDAYPGLFEPIVVRFDVEFDLESSTETADATPPVSTGKPSRGPKATETR